MTARGKVLLRSGVAVALLLLTAAFVGWVVLSFREASRQTVSFPDGSRLTVLGASLSSGAFTTEKPWQASLRRWLPAKWQGWLPVPMTFPATPSSPAESLWASNSIWVWFTLVDARGTNILTNLPDAKGRFWARTEVVSDSGFRFGASRTEVRSLLVGGTPFYRMRLVAFPRRQRQFELQFLDQDLKLIGSVSVANPDRGPFPEWMPERLPITHTNGPLVVVLEEFREARPETRTTFGTRFIPTYKLSYDRAGGDPDWRLQPPYFLWSDATGNLGGDLDYQENAWKLSLEFRRWNETGFSDAERFVVSGLKVPEPGTLQMLTNEFERLGTRFTLRCLAGAGGLPETDNSPPGLLPASSRVGGVKTSRPAFLLEDNQPFPPTEILFRIVDSSGRELLRQVRASGMRWSPASSYYASLLKDRAFLVEFDATNATGTISFEVNLDPPRTFEYIVNPAEVQRLNATAR